MFSKAIYFFIPKGIQDTPENYRRYKLIISIILITAFFDFNYALITIIINLSEGTFIMFFAMIMHLVILMLVRKQVPLLLATNLYVFIGCLAVVVCIYFSGGLNSPVLPWLATGPIVALLMAGWSTGLFWMIINLLCVIFFGFMTRRNFVFPTSNDQGWNNIFYLNCYCGLIMIIFLVAIVFENERNIAIRKLNENNKLLLEEKRKTVLYEVSQEIHDNVGQTLSLAKLNLYLIHQFNDNHSPSKLLDTINLLGKAISDLRNISHNLSSNNNIDFDLIEAIRDEVNIITKINCYQIDFNISGKHKKLNPQTELILFRITQECLNNIIKHAMAKMIIINVEYTPNLFCLTVTDNGIGIDFKKLIAAEHGGINNMRDRIKVLGGNFEINSHLEQGTEIIIKLPI